MVNDTIETGNPLHGFMNSPMSPVGSVKQSGAVGTKAGKAIRKRVASKYNKVYSKHYKALKKKHPRSKFAVLVKRAHRLAKRELR